MITREDALSATRFHENHDPAGKIYEWRRNGACKTWKTRPDEFQLPIKYGIRVYNYLTEVNADQFHRADQCPTRHVRVSTVNDGTYVGIVTAEADGKVTKVHVTVKGTSKHRVGSEVNIEAGTVLVTDL